MSSPSNRRYSSASQLLLYSLSLFVFLAVFYFLKETITLEELIAIIQGIPLQGVVLFVICSFTMSLFRSWRYILLLRIAGYETNKLAMFLITLVRNLFSDFLPARLGSLIYIYLSRTRLGVSWSSASASFAYSFIFDILALGFLISMAAISTLGFSRNPELLVFIGLFLAGCSIGCLFIFPWLLRFTINMLPNLRIIPAGALSKISTGLQAFHQELLLIQRSGMLLRVVYLSFAVRCFKYLSLYVLLISLVIPLGYALADFPLPKVFLGLTAAEMAASLPISGIAGFGAYEGAWSLVFQLLGYSQKLSALTSISHHLLTQFYGYILGAVSLLMLLLLRKVENTQDKTRVRSYTRKGFYLRFASLLLLFFSSSALVLSTSENLFSATPSPSPAAAIPSDPAPGKVVFQHPDGIYTVTIGDRKERRISASGTAPRWSPDGTQIAFVDENKIMLMSKNGQNKRQLATSSKGKAVCFHPNGLEVLYTDDQYIKSVNIDSGKKKTLARGSSFVGVDISHDGKILTVTEKRFGGYQVVTINQDTGRRVIVSSGCSGSISPKGDLVTVNSRGHKEVYIFDRNNKERTKTVRMIDNLKFDNHFWSNSEHWIASRSEGETQNIYVHHVPTSAGFRVTTFNRCDRPDYYVQ